MRGSVRKRGNWWEYRLELGLQPKQRCQTCGAEFWPEGRPLAACPCGGQLEDVQRRRERTRGGFRTKKLAQEALDKAKVAVQEGEYVEPSKLTVADYLLRMWLPSIEASLRPSTYRATRCTLEPTSCRGSAQSGCRSSTPSHRRHRADLLDRRQDAPSQAEEGERR